MDPVRVPQTRLCMHRYRNAKPPSTWMIFYSMEVAMQHTGGPYYRNSIARVIAHISGVFDWRMGTGSLWRVARFLIGGRKLEME